MRRRSAEDRAAARRSIADGVQARHERRFSYIDPPLPRADNQSTSQVIDPRPLLVYFIQAGECGPIKIGQTRDPSRRLAEIATHCPEPVRIVALVKGVTEAAVHARFAAYRTNLEWFDPSRELVDAINGLFDLSNPAIAMMRETLGARCPEDMVTPSPPTKETT